MGKVAIVINVETLERPFASSQSLPRANANQPLRFRLSAERGRFTFFADLGSASQIAVAPAPFLRDHP